MEQKPAIVAQRLTELCEGIQLSQARLAAQFDGVEQPVIFMYENAQSFLPYECLCNMPISSMYRLIIFWQYGQAAGKTIRLSTQGTERQQANVGAD
ncbi:MAG: hypothetical protein SO434_02870 [Eubacteriales bacterium]|nr:hypothetical protein [Eubacteriales bacterium]